MFVLFEYVFYLNEVYEKVSIEGVVIDTMFLEVTRFYIISRHALLFLAHSANAVRFVVLMSFRRLCSSGMFGHTK